MKNSKIYIALMFFLFAWACNPLEDELEIAEANNSIPTADIEYTLTEDDYETADDFCDCSGFGNFSSEDDVRSAIPVVLDDVFPALGGGSSALVTYDFFNGSSPDIRGTQTIFEVPTEDYDLFHNDPDGFDNFGDVNDEVVDYVNWKGFTGGDGDYIDITFDVFTGGQFTPDTTSRIVYTVAYGWMYAEPLPDDSYGDFFGESPPDFSFEDEGEDNIPFWLKATKIFAVEGDRALIQWNWDNGPGTSQSVALFHFSGGEWIEYGDFAQTTQETLAFGHDGSGWVPDNTIKYTLTGDDYTAIAAAYLSSNPDGSDSMSNFGNYDIGLWSSTEIFESITTRLLEIFPSTGAGQKYLVTYAVWKPGNDNFTINVIYDGSSWEQITD